MTTADDHAPDTPPAQRAAVAALGRVLATPKRRVVAAVAAVVAVATVVSLLVTPDVRLDGDDEQVLHTYYRYLQGDPDVSDPVARKIFDTSNRLDGPGGTVVLARPDGDGCWLLAVNADAPTPPFRGSVDDCRR